MKTIMITVALFCISIVYSQTINPDSKSTISDSRSRTAQTPKKIRYTADLPMYELATSVSTNKTKLNPSLSINLKHPHRISQRPDVLVAVYSPPLIQDLFKLRQQYIGLMNKIAYETADVQLEGVPKVHWRDGRGRDNVIKKSSRDNQGVRRRTEQTAINYLQRVLRKHFRNKIFAITDKINYHFKLPAGDYVLCIMQRIKDPATKTITGSKTAIWWTRFTVEDGKAKTLDLDETNAGSWRDIFVVEAH